MARPAPEESVERIRSAAGKLKRKVRLMEVCGTHTMAVGRAGLRTLLPENVELVSGPGCPVCVTPQREIEQMILLSRTPGVTVCTFGDMVRVPGVDSSLERERAAGADVRVVYSASDALELAEKEKEIVFIAVGFETTAPGVAAVALEAFEKGVSNFSLLVSHKLIPPAMEALLDGGSSLDGYMTPGHVSVIIGSRAYEPLARRHAVPCVATGFDPEDILEGVAMLLELIIDGRAGSFIQYRRAVRVEGNPRAREVMYRAYRISDAEWRGLGVIPESGLELRPEFDSLDAAKKFSLPELPPVEIPGCRCGEVLKGLIRPAECPLFGSECTPGTPVGPCMVSSEGSCAARYRYG